MRELPLLVTVALTVVLNFPLEMTSSPEVVALRFHEAPPTPSFQPTSGGLGPSHRVPVCISSRVTNGTLAGLLPEA